MSESTKGRDTQIRQFVSFGNFVNYCSKLKVSASVPITATATATPFSSFFGLIDFHFCALVLWSSLLFLNYFLPSSIPLQAINYHHKEGHMRRCRRCYLAGTQLANRSTDSSRMHRYLRGSTRQRLPVCRLCLLHSQKECIGWTPQCRTHICRPCR
jgi:hypothetical protein